MKYEIAIKMQDNSQLDALIVGLVKQGYAVYYNEEEGVLCFTTTDEEVTELEENNES